MKKNIIHKNSVKIKSLEDFLKLNHSEILKLSDKELVKGLRYFRTDLKYDLRKKLQSRSKGKIRQVRDVYLSMLSVPSPKLFSPSKKNKKATQEFLAVGKNWKKFLVNRTEEQKIVFKDGQLVIKGRFFDESRAIFDKKRLASDPAGEVKRVLRGKNFDTSKLICGDAFIGGHSGYKDYGQKQDLVLVEEELTQDVVKLMNDYNNINGNHYWGEWLNGVELLTLKNQKKMSKTKSSRLSNVQKKKKNRSGGLRNRSV